jgi:hypothetical protein
MASGIVEPQGPEQQQRSQSQQGLSRSRLVQRLLAAGGNLPAFLHDLIYAQAAHVAGTEAAAFLLERVAQPEPGEQAGAEAAATVALRPVAHIRPDSSDAPTRAAAVQAFQEIIKPCILQGKDGAIEVGAAGDNAEPQFCLVTLLRSESEIVAASAVVTRCRDMERAQQRLMSMQLVAGYFDLYTLRRTAEQSRQIAQSHQHVLQLAGAVSTADGFASGAMNLCNELATRTGASRVSLGWLKGRQIRVQALSHTEQFDKKQELIVQVEKAMEECYDQEEVVHFSSEGEGTQNVTRDAAALSRAQGGNTVISLPLRNKSEIVGVLTLEFSPGTKLAPQAATGLAVAADVLAPQLYDRYQNDRWLITKAGLSIRNTGRMAIGPKHMLAKLLIGLGIAAVAFVIFYKPVYYVQGEFAFTPIEKRYMAAPFDGELEAVFVKPGDVVSAGTKLFALRTFDLETKRSGLQSESLRYDLEAQKALADRSRTAQPDVAGYKLAQARKRGVDAQIRMIQDQINRSTVFAPFDGQVLQVSGGDLQNKLHAPVRLGEDLMEFGQRDKLEVELRLADRFIQDVHLGQKGYIRTKGQPQDRYAVTVQSIVPQPQAVEGDNVYTVYARLDEESSQWQPGQEGEVRLEAGERTLVWILTHRLTEWLRMKTWGWPVVGG